MLLDVPVIDISSYRSGDRAARLALGEQVDETCRDIGFLVITGHGVPKDLIDEVDAVSRALFDLPIQEKMRVARPAPDIARGYIPIEGESVARSRGENAPGDLNESFMIGPVDVADDAYHFGPAAGKHFAPNLWPEFLRRQDRPAHLAPAGAQLPGAGPRAGAGAAPRRRAFRLRQPHHSESGGQSRRTAGLQQGGRVGGRTDRAGLLRRQYRRPDGALDQRPLGLDPGEPPRYPATTSGEHLRSRFVATQTY
jgi:hypothetical protein